MAQQVHHVVVVGGGPAGLYAAYLLKRSRRSRQVTLIEQNPPDATYGFGVVFSDRALAFMREDDPESCAAIEPELETWDGLTLSVDGEAVTVDGNGFGAIGRMALLALLQARCRTVGVDMRFNQQVDDLARFADSDLIIIADGANSAFRSRLSDKFRTRMAPLTNRFAWFGVARSFPNLSLTFRHDDAGIFCAHHYRFAPDRSTFIVEVDAATFERAGFAQGSEEEAKAYCERVFAADLDGQPLLTNRSIWRTFPRVTNERWVAGRHVLIGDAQRTAHFSIGSGTRLAMEDAIALSRALDQIDDVTEALAAFEAGRRPIVEKLVAAAEVSAMWYEDMASHVDQPLLDFVYSYMTRTGRLSDERLMRISPLFAGQYLASKGAGASAGRLLRPFE